ncbi:MAG: AmmeMemoRadiSam system protein A [Spirochaetales bacterium]|nr:AmmeMemoRadiSam system protein A [Spirochaetales bacterium]
MEFNLTDEEKRILLVVARTSILHHFTGEISDYPEPTPALLEPCGAFVTLHKKGRLRGCIGYVVAVKPLFVTVKDVAASSAFSDPRFPPVTKDETGSLEIEISVLSPLRKIDDVDEIEVGKHGIMIRRGFASGLLLPQVATDNNWDLSTFLSHTCMKAGLTGDCWKQPDTSIEIFSASVFNEKEFGLP